ncbi:Fungal specific transcription factor domain-containing protein [Cladophialophora immunda]|nr:Fungal specific transcription factor domain-containing protein [Cladophialophora immunda]
MLACIYPLLHWPWQVNGRRITCASGQAVARPSADLIIFGDTVSTIHLEVELVLAAELTLSAATYSQIQKDEEAGGEGLGIVATRKRLWRDADGNIVSKRPSLPQPAARTKEDAVENGNSCREKRSREGQPASRTEALPLETCIVFKSTSQQACSTEDAEPTLDCDTADHMMSTTFFPVDEGAPRSPTSPMRTKSAPDVLGSNLETDLDLNGALDKFIDSEYNWFWDVDDLSTWNVQSPQSIAGQTETLVNKPGTTEDVTSHAQSNTVTAKNMVSHSISPDATIRDGATDCRLRPLPHSRPEPLPPPLPTPMSFVDEISLLDFRPSSLSPSRAQNTVTAASSTPSIAFSPPERHENPVIGAVSRDQILEIVVQARTRTSDNVLVDENHPLLSLSALQDYCDVFFTHLNKTFPLIHAAAFDPSQTSPLLLLSLLILGASCGDDDAHHLAVCIHDAMKPQILQSVASSVVPELWLLQTVLLAECFGVWRAGEKQHHSAHLFHGSLINLIQRSDCLSVAEPAYSDALKDVESRWHHSMEIEQRKRLAYLCFLLDTQRAVLFSQQPNMSATDFRSALPCSSVVWEARSAEEWDYQVTQQQAPESFLTVLRSYLSRPMSTRYFHLDGISYLLLLHGLMSVALNLKRTSDMSLGCNNLSDSSDWRSRMATSYDLWKADFDVYCFRARSSSRPSHSDGALEIGALKHFADTTLAVYHAAHITLNVDISLLQTFAGAPLISKWVTKADRQLSSQKVQAWATGGAGRDPAHAAVWHAAHILRSCIVDFNGQQPQYSFQYPWCVYLASLTYWAFSRVRQGRDVVSGMVPLTSMHNKNNCNQRNEVGTTTEATLEALAQISALISGGPDRLSESIRSWPMKGLITAINTRLNDVQWGVALQGMRDLVQLND